MWRREPAARPWPFALRRNEATIAALIVLLGLGLAALQLLPQLAAGSGRSSGRPRSRGAGAGTISSRHYRPAAQPCPGGIYAYLGIVPFLFLVGLPAAVRRGEPPGAFGLGLLVVLAFLARAVGWFSRAGVPARMLAWGDRGLALAGLGLDALWRWSAANLRLRRMRVPAALRWAAAWLGLSYCWSLALLSRRRSISREPACTALRRRAGDLEVNLSDVLRFFAGAVSGGLLGWVQL